MHKALEYGLISIPLLKCLKVSTWLFNNEMAFLPICTPVASPNRMHPSQRRPCCARGEGTKGELQGRKGTRRNPTPMKITFYVSVFLVNNSWKQVARISLRATTEEVASEGNSEACWVYFP